MARGAVWRDPRARSSIAGLRRCRCLTDPVPTHLLGQRGLVTAPSVGRHSKRGVSEPGRLTSGAP